MTVSSADERCSSDLPKAAERFFCTFWAMTDDVSFEWAFSNYNQMFSCKQLCVFFLTDDRSSPKKSFDSCQARQRFLDSYRDLHKTKFWQLSSRFECYWMMIDHVLVEWAFTSYNQVFSCKQFRNIFFDRGVRSSSLNTKRWQLSSNLEFYWQLIIFLLTASCSQVS